MLRHFGTSIRPTMLVLGILLVPGTALGLPGFDGWMEPFNLPSQAGPVGPVNTPAVDGCVSLSRDGLELYFTSNRTGKFEVYVAHRSSTDQGFGAPTKLPPSINSAGASCPTIVGRNTLYVVRLQSGDPGDIYVSHRSSGGWSQAVPVTLMNSSLLDETVSSFENESGQEVLVWSSRNPDGSGGVILQSVAGGAPELVPGSPNSVGSNNRPSFTHDGLTIFFDSVRPGSLGGPDLYYATRDNTSEPFGPAIHMDELSSTGFDARPTISWDGAELFFSSNRAGSSSPAPDVWVTKRSKARGPKIIEFGGQ